MNRGKKAVYNSLANALSQVVTLICGLILPRLILSTFGSSNYGITASVSQFLSVISLFRAGVGGVTRATLYKSLAQNDTQQISATIKATEIFMRKVALIFIGVVVTYSALYPYLVRNEFEWGYAASLVLIISLSSFIQYFFGITYEMLFQADQRQYISALLGIVAIILNTIISIILIKLGVGIHGVKLGSAVAFSITPIALNILAKKWYHLDRNVKPDFSSIKQRWDAFFHHLAAFIHNNTDITLLTIFSNTKEIAVYSVYYVVAGGLKNVMHTLTTGVESAFGSIMANNEKDNLVNNVMNYETMLHVVACVLFGSAISLVTPFVQVYTMNITDVNYTRYTFGYLAIIGEMLFVLRSPYEALVNAAGHFKQTKKYAFIEASINLLLSIIMVHKYGLIGVVIGTVISIIFRTFAYAIYASKEIIHRSIFVFYKRYIVTGLTIISAGFLSSLMPMLEMNSYVNWIIYAIGVTFVSISVTIIYNLIFFRKQLFQMIKKIGGIIKSIIYKR